MCAFLRTSHSFVSAQTTHLHGLKSVAQTPNTCQHPSPTVNRPPPPPSVTSLSCKCGQSQSMIQRTLPASHPVVKSINPGDPGRKKRITEKKTRGWNLRCENIYSLHTKASLVSLRAPKVGLKRIPVRSQDKWLDILVIHESRGLHGPLCFSVLAPLFVLVTLVPDSLHHAPGSPALTRARASL